jgi:sigma-B regulation protein RsbU (phosphoserine phosphatase)
MSILIVDDSEEQQELLADTLRTAGYRAIRFADSAAGALQALGVGGPASPAAPVDIVLMDVRMPGMDGLAACRRIREDGRYDHLPIIVVTATSEGADITAAYTAGATDYIRKPVVPAELVARVSMAMTLKEEFAARTEREHDLAAQAHELGKKVHELKALRGTLSVCTKCKRVKTASGYWQRMEDYLEAALNATISSGICTKCTDEQAPRVSRT